METPHSDDQLIAAVRAGESAAFETLYNRHAGAARRLAVALARNPSDADDLVAEAFAKLLGTLRDGGGPNVAFRAYLLTTVRNLFYDRARRDARVQVTDDLSRHDTGVPFVDSAVERLERQLVARAFARLPERWQTVLWHTHVEGDRPAAIAPLLGLTPNGVATLAYRARERLRQNYLREHATTSQSERCQSTVGLLGAYVRNGLSKRDRTAVDDHLSGCRRCEVLFVELGDINASLRTVLAPVVLGGAAAAYCGPSSAGPLAGLGATWRGVRRTSQRRSAQVGAAGVFAAAAVALALVLTGNPGAEPDRGLPGAGPGAQPAETPAPAQEPSPSPSPRPSPSEPDQPTVPPTPGPIVSPPANTADEPEPGSGQEPGSGGQQPADGQTQPAPDESPGPGGIVPPEDVTPPPVGNDGTGPPGDEPVDDEPGGEVCLVLRLPPLLGLEVCT